MKSQFGFAGSLLALALGCTPADTLTCSSQSLDSELSTTAETVASQYNSCAESQDCSTLTYVDLSCDGNGSSWSVCGVPFAASSQLEFEDALEAELQSLCSRIPSDCIGGAECEQKSVVCLEGVCTVEP